MSHLKNNTNKLKEFIFEQKCIPWSVSSRYENWLEQKIHFQTPSLYQLLKYGRIQKITSPLTEGPEHHFFGYYEKTPWNKSATKILAHQAQFNNRPPEANDSVKIGFIDPESTGKFEAVSESHAWNWQQGSMLQWHPDNCESSILFNDRQNDQFINVSLNIETGLQSTLDLPIYAISPTGKEAFSLNFARLFDQRPGYGYAGLKDPFSHEKHPINDGIFHIDMESGKTKLIISLDQLANNTPLASMQDSYHWINHIQISPKGTKLAFFHIWRTGENGWSVRLYTANLDGTNLTCVLDTGEISHYDWRDEKTILIWAKHPKGGTYFLLCDTESDEINIIGEKSLKVDGHCSYSPDRKWILNDTYPDRYNMRSLMIIRATDSKIIELDRFHSPKEKWWGEIRCDLHPRWNREGNKICIDSVHTGKRQMHIIDLKGYL